MKGEEKKSIAAIMAAVLLTSAFPMTAYADKISDLEDQINQRREEKEETENEISKREDELEELNETTEGLKGQLNTLNANLTEVSNQLEDLESRIQAKNKEIEQTEAELEEARRIEEEQYAAMKKRIKFMYEKRDYMILELLFGSSGFSDFLNRSEYIQKLSSSSFSS